jgi:L-ascorbate metabolism protein UlaG (beta-lactamase superfamily)
MEITWIGWDCFMVKTSGKTIYFDPVFGTYDEPGDIILISHSHSDHHNTGTLAKIKKPGTVVLTSVENKDAVKGIGLSPGESHTIDSIRVSARHAYNLVKGPKPGSVFHPKGFGLGWIVEAEGKTLYHLGDTELIPEMKGITSIDVMMIPISGFYVMDIDEAVETVKLIRPKLVIPMHFDVVDADPENQPDYNLYANPQEFAGKLEGIAEVSVMNHGETISV